MPIKVKAKTETGTITPRTTLDLVGRPPGPAARENAAVDGEVGEACSGDDDGRAVDKDGNPMAFVAVTGWKKGVWGGLRPGRIREGMHSVSLRKDTNVLKLRAQLRFHWWQGGWTLKMVE